MSMFKVEVKAINPKDESKQSVPIDALVDTGSELSWLPRQLLEELGIAERRTRNFVTANDERINRDVGYAILQVDNYQTIDEVVFAEKGDMILLGVRTIEGFGVLVDNIRHRFVAQATLAC